MPDSAHIIDNNLDNKRYTKGYTWRDGRAWLWRLAIRAYVRWKMRRAVDGVFVKQLHILQETLQKGPALVAINHVGWFDTLLLILLDMAIDADSFGIMDARGLQKYPLFAHVGVLPIRKDTPALALQDLFAASQVLDRPQRALWIFPQGKQRLAHARPLGFRSGIVATAIHHAEKTGKPIPIIPVAMQYLFRQKPEPSIWINVNTPIYIHPHTYPTQNPAEIPTQIAKILEQLENAVTEKLDEIDADALHIGDQANAAKPWTMPASYINITH